MFVPMVAPGAPRRVGVGVPFPPLKSFGVGAGAPGQASVDGLGLLLVKSLRSCLGLKLVQTPSALR